MKTPIHSKSPGACTWNRSCRRLSRDTLPSAQPKIGGSGDPHRYHDPPTSCQHYKFYLRENQAKMIKRGNREMSQEECSSMKQFLRLKGSPPPWRVGLRPHTLRLVRPPSNHDCAISCRISPRNHAIAFITESPHVDPGTPAKQCRLFV